MVSLFLVLDFLFLKALNEAIIEATDYQNFLSEIQELQVQTQSRWENYLDWNIFMDKFFEIRSMSNKHHDVFHFDHHKNFQELWENW